ncbi:TrkA C-terminal domain-containing protein [Proteinivorax hydrogeniformans]|uniref:TrkA C-terminal domain-containing protein n=1 Tax=Proteinivorax hydrogeniformans TaxID=1826727 RepID=A0AAU8HW23_9FIRM
MLVLAVCLIIFLVFVMEVGAIAFKITGVESSNARFQSLSAITGTGFTTKDADVITRSKTRKKICMFLMVIGHIGLAVIVAFALNLQHFFSTWQLLVGSLLAILTYLFAKNRVFVDKLDKQIETQLVKKLHFRKEPIEEVLIINDEYKVAEVKLEKECSLTDKSLASLHLTTKDILVLAVKGEEGVILAPKGKDIIRKGDTLTVYGKIKNLEEIICK